MKIFIDSSTAIRHAHSNFRLDRSPPDTENGQYRTQSRHGCGNIFHFIFSRFKRKRKTYKCETGRAGRRAKIKRKILSSKWLELWHQPKFVSIRRIDCFVFAWLKMKKRFSRCKIHRKRESCCPMRDVVAIRSSVPLIACPFNRNRGTNRTRTPHIMDRAPQPLTICSKCILMRRNSSSNSSSSASGRE